MGRSVLSPTQLSVEMISPMPFIVILLVIGSINAMPNPTMDIETDGDVTPPTSNPPDTGVTANYDSDNVFMSNLPRDKRSPKWKKPSYCFFRHKCSRCDYSKCKSG